MQLPARIGKYELEEYLGGGMSRVYRATDTVIGRTVAIKILTESGLEDGEVKARFLAEARTAGSISHENILGIYDFGEDEQHRPFIVMEFLKGEDLRHAIQNGHTGDIANKIRIASQIARALDFVHSHKVVHRDIKPGNIHITTAGQVKLMDFGISKTEGRGMTRTGYMVGTPYYMAPEQVAGGEITPQVDVYAFGVLLYELIVGTHPIAGDTMERVFYCILNEPLNLDPMRAHAPEALCQVVARCTAKNPAERPAGLGPVCAELEQMLKGGSERDVATVALPQRQAAPAPPAPAPAPAKSGRPGWLIPAVGLIVVLAAVAAFLALRPSGPAKALSTPSGEMVLVPAGKFLFGEKKEPAELPAFYIDKTEVTNAAYKQFADETHHNLPEGFAGDKAGYPVVNVTFDDAQAFAQWAGKRLPTAKEWEKAARGTDGRAYPWGENADAKLANVDSKQIHPASDLALGASPFGALQMVGNVWELVNESVTPSAAAQENFAKSLVPPPGLGEAWHAARGQGFNDALSPNAIWDYYPIPARWKHDDIGFRCVKDIR